MEFSGSVAYSTHLFAHEELFQVFTCGKIRKCSMNDDLDRKGIGRAVQIFLLNSISIVCYARLLNKKRVV